jgi:M6 family metalloprotease-like protein
VRGPALLLAGILLAAPAGEDAAAGLRVRPAARGEAAPASAAEARALEVQRARLERWRSFPHHLSDPRVDWSPRANRRRGWRPPPQALRNPHARDFGLARGVAPAAMAAAAQEPPDTVRVAFIRIDFLTDRGGTLSTGDGRFDLSGPDTTLPAIDRPPHDRRFYLAHLEALRRYYDVQSYGRVVIEGDVWPRSDSAAYSVSDMADFGPWRFSQEIYRAAVHMFRTMLFAADSQSVALGDPLPWDAYDRFMIIHAGSDFQSDLRGDSPLDIPSFTIGVADTDVVIFPDSTNRPVDRAAVVPETASQDGFYGALNGVIAHENGHNLFGFADLYDIRTGFPVVGLWSLMDSGNLAGSEVALPGGDVIFATGLLPPSLDPFHRFFCGDSLRFAEPSWGDTIAVRDGQRHADMRRVFLSSDEYLVLENRAIAAGDTIELDQDSTTRVVLGPKSPDRFEYDALLPGPGMLLWHVDASVVPFETAFRVNPDFGFNTRPGRPGVSVLEADGLGDLGDPGSPFILGSPLDPFFRSNVPVLSDTTIPRIQPHLGTHPHLRLDFLDDPGPVMRFRARRAWEPDGWPVAVEFPPGGPLLMAVDADGDRRDEVCWAGGASGSPDSAAIFAVRGDGRLYRDSTAVVARLDRRPRPLMAALLTDLDLGGQPQGPALFAVSTHADGPDTSTAGGRVYLLDHQGSVLPGWPAALPAVVTTAPVIAGLFPNARLYVGAADGRVYALGLTGAVLAASAPLGAPIRGRLAVDADPPGVAGWLVAAGTESGETAVLEDDGAGAVSLRSGWPRALLGAAGFEPEFLWMDFDGRGQPASGSATCPAGRTLITHHADRLWAHCADGAALPGWGRSAGDTLASGLGAADPDGDGYAEVLTQSVRSRVAFWNQSGYPSPGWPRRATREDFRTDSPPLALDVDGDGRIEVVALNASGILAALGAGGRAPAGWPLATGAGASGAPVAARLGVGAGLHLVAPDRAVPDSLRFEANGRFGTLYAYGVPAASPLNGAATAWTTVGGDIGRTATLPLQRSPAAPAAAAGPYVAGSLKAYPNPARNQPVTLAYQLTEPAEVEIRILDSSGHQVASFKGQGRRADNVHVWEPGRASAGLYVARLHLRSGAREHVETVLVGVLR